MEGGQTGKVSCESWLGSHESEVGISGYQSSILSFIVRRCYQATAIEDREVLVFAVVICSVCKSVTLLTIICGYELQAFDKSSYQSKPDV
jgi:hypothetical protein